MGTYKVLWSMRGRVIVEADDEDEAMDKFYTMAAKGEGMDDCDGYEVDEVEAIEEEE